MCRTQYGNNALLRAAIYGHANTIKVLVECGADSEARNSVRIVRAGFMRNHEFAGELAQQAHPIF